mmetsp:Transcript_85988/g.125808  ORF Transcript_85988/g.125808 Transcript_85988/m.125808 type:complete len:185 (-) Transcript_85988:172-726(-)
MNVPLRTLRYPSLSLCADYTFSFSNLLFGRFVAQWMLGKRRCCSAARSMATDFGGTFNGHRFQFHLHIQGEEALATKVLPGLPHFIGAGTLDLNKQPTNVRLCIHACMRKTDTRMYLDEDAIYAAYNFFEHTHVCMLPLTKLKSSVSQSRGGHIKFYRKLSHNCITTFRAQLVESTAADAILMH